MINNPIVYKDMRSRLIHKIYVQAMYLYLEETPVVDTGLWARHLSTPFFFQPPGHCEARRNEMFNNFRAVNLPGEKLERQIRCEHRPPR